MLSAHKLNAQQKKTYNKNRSCKFQKKNYVGMF